MLEARIYRILPLLVFLLNPVVVFGYGLDLDTLNEEKKAHYDSVFQDSLKAFEEELVELQDTILESDDEGRRVQAMRNYIPTLVEALQVPGSIYHPFEEVQFMFTHMPEDESFRLYNWVMEFDDGEHRYYGAIQKNTTDEFELYPLTDASEDLPDKPENKILDHENWYGALYYEMLQVEDYDGNAYYTLLGWDGYDRHSQLKMVDVLTFDHDDRPQFGAPVFLYKGENEERERQDRVFFEYSEDAVMSLNVAEGTDIIVFDQLVPLAGSARGGRTEMVPDGSYSSFNFREGTWLERKNPFDTFEEFYGREGEDVPVFE